MRFTKNKASIIWFNCRKGCYIISLNDISNGLLKDVELII